MNAAQSGGHAGGGGVGKKGSQMEELVGIPPDRRNWRGILIALLVIAVVFSLIIFSIFLLTPDEEDLRYYGAPLTLNDVLSEKYRWNKFNGSWHNGYKLLYRNVNEGISLMNVKTLKRQILISSTILRQLNVETYSLSPDSKFILLQTDQNLNGSRCFIYELATENIFSLSPSTKEIEEQPPHLQFIAWSPVKKGRSGENSSKQLSSSRYNADALNLNESILINASKQAWTNVSNDDENIYTIQGIAFVYENDIYYKPSILENSLTYRLTTSGKTGVIYNGVPNWIYANDPELSLNNNNFMQFSPNGKYLTYVTFNDSEVNEYRYTWLGDTSVYPTVLTQRYPKYGMNNPLVRVFVVNLKAVIISSKSVPIVLKLPSELIDKVGYIGGIHWVSSISSSNNYLSLLITNRAQTRTNTILCEEPEFKCVILHTEFTTNYSKILTSEKVTFPSMNGIAIIEHTLNISNLKENFIKHNGIYDTPKRFEVSSNGINILKRIPIQNHINGGHYRQIVFISSEDRRTVIPLTKCQLEVTKIIGWDANKEVIYFMGAPIYRSDERHLYKVRLQLVRSTKINRTRVISNEEECICLTCNNISTTIYTKLDTNQTHNKTVHNYQRHYSTINSNDNINIDFDINNENHAMPNNCLYNHIQFSSDYCYYIQECLGPEVPTVYLVDTHSNQKILTLDYGVLLRHQLTQNALPQIRILNVEINNGFHAKVKLFIPPEIRDEAEITYPLILQIDASPGSQLVNQRFDVNWNWYLCSQREFVVAQIDGRGSGFQGEELRAQVYGKLGKLEVEDQLAVLKYLSENLKFIDSSRICAYGWGYGGYITSMALIEDSEQLLRCAIAINPITTFTHFYSYYSERFMPPIGNYMQSLQDAELSLHAGNVKGRNLMLIHSTADTFIHQEHTLMFIKALVNQNIKFKHQIYPDEDHAITNALFHVYQVMEWYIDDCFSPVDDYDWNPTRLFVF